MDTVKIDARDVNFWYGDFHALKGISMQIEEKSVVAFIGPSGCGKSTFLRLFNRMNDLIPATRLEGRSVLTDRISMRKEWKWTNSQECGNGIPASQPVSEKYIRECGLRASGKRGKR